ncbi:MAG TPA: YkvA family protein [Pontibacter sp.]
MNTQTPDGKDVAQSSFFKRFLAKAERYLKHPAEVTKLLNQAFKKATAKKSVGSLAAEAWENLQLLSRMIKAAVAGDYKGIPTSTLVGGVAVIIYFITPIDLIPDIIPVIGLLDDASLLAWFMTSIKSELDRFKEWEVLHLAQQRQEAHNNAPHNADPSFGTPKYSDRAEGTVEVKKHNEQ